LNEKRERRGLGRGLSALMADVAPALDESNSERPRSGVINVPIDKVRPNPMQPRKTFAAEALEELAESIRAKGILQPLIVRPDGRDGYEIVAGERRWRAAQIAQLHDLPVLPRDLDDSEVMEVAIIENIQRSDLNALEEAEGFRQLMDRFGHTQDKIATALGKSRSHIANLLRLLSLPPEVQGYLRDGRLSAGHARALVTSEDPSALARRVVSQGLSVRETEALVREAGSQGATRQRGAKGKASSAEKDADTRALEQDLSANLRMSVVIDHRPSEGGGQVIIRYKNLDDLDQLCQILSQVR
jgi:ParB family transcriptional regulator, chromosome partitioning protein